MVVPGAVHAEDFTNKDFLKLQETHQKFWIQGAVDALAQVASAKDNKTGRCIMEWYYGPKHAARNGLILASIEKYPDAHPSAVMLALTERACGVFRK
ncbi:MAG: hypothetical protein KUG80_03765 [Gammaproteobacteria bacterium]|nr:hypothetical protein [Gammaproteobacteria bacterium]